MKSSSLLGATIVDEAKAVAIINYCLFSSTPRKPSPPPHTRVCKCKVRVTPPQAAYKPAPCPLDGIVLRPRVVPQPLEVQPKQLCATEAPYQWQPRQGLSFPRSLCYLLAVQEHNWPSATVELGYYPSVSDLLCSPLVEKFSTVLVEQTPGLYHMKGKYVRGAVPLFQAKSTWRVGAHLPSHPYPGHNTGYPQRPLPRFDLRPLLGPRPPLPPQSMLAPAIPLGVPAPKPRGKGKPK